MDSTLVAGLLARLDVVAQKAGMGAEAVWGLWMVTAWRPMMEVGMCIAAAAVLLGLFTRVHKAARAEGYSNALDSDNIFTAIGGMMAGIGFIICAAAALLSLPDAILYLAKPELYALAQLTKMIGGQ